MEGYHKGFQVLFSPTVLPTNADLKGKNAHLLSENGFVGVHFETEGIKNLSVDVDIPGKFNAYNALAAISAVSFFERN